MAVDVLGAPIKRREDPRFITGEGNYLDLERIILLFGKEGEDSHCTGKNCSQNRI